MKSSTNSEIMHSKQHETKQVSQLGMTLTLHVTTEIRPQWGRVYRHPATGAVIDPNLGVEDLKRLLGDFKPVMSWEKTGEAHTQCYVTQVLFQDEEDCTVAKPIELISTIEGPILGIVYEEADTTITLMDPCLIQYNNGRISFVPIFNTARTLRLERTAVRCRQAPAEVLVASYPGFVMENRMSKYQLRPTISTVHTPEVGNAAEDIVAVGVRH